MSEQESTQEQIRNREGWLTDFMVAFMPWIKERADLTLSDGMIKLSCGFPSRGGTARKNKTIGQCFHSAASGRKTHEIFVHPTLDDAVKVGETVAHEILHAVLPAGAGHRKPFSQAAKKIGLEGKPTHTHASEELIAEIRRIEQMIGEYPHESLDAGGGPKRINPLRKVMCPICGYLCRVTMIWIEEAGCPICPQCFTSMQEAEVEEVASMPLVSYEQHVVYRVKSIDSKPGDRDKWDHRWMIQMHRKGTERPTFSIIDYGPPTRTDEITVKGEDGNPMVMKVARLGDAVLGEEMLFPRLTPAKSREDAIALLESLRDGSMTYDDLDEERDTGQDVDDPFYLDEGEEEILDTEPEYTPEELETYEQELRDREQERPKVEGRDDPLRNPAEDDFERILAERTAELMSLYPTKKQRNKRRAA